MSRHIRIIGTAPSDRIGSMTIARRFLRRFGVLFSTIPAEDDGVVGALATAAFSLTLHTWERTERVIVDVYARDENFDPTPLLLALAEILDAHSLKVST